jgi:hypothetical protein
VSARYGLENERQGTEIDLKTDVQTGSVTGDIYNVQNRLENVNKRIESSQRITPHNRMLIRKFCDHCSTIILTDLKCPLSTLTSCAGYFVVSQVLPKQRSLWSPSK